MAPTTPILPHFPRFDPITFDRSPSRSPRRKAQFAFRELDPLLANLSPESTLRALRATETISNGDAQEDALASSIADATPAEREIGIRAAFAAQKLREWKKEVSNWTWPGKKERTLGLGFTPPPNAQETNTAYCGCLPVAVVEEYEARLEDIRDDLDSLRINEIKEHVLESHRPSSGTKNPSNVAGTRTSYGRMRDFTALVTATVIQTLPDLAKLNALLDTWDIRLRVLRELPRFLDIMQQALTEIRQAFIDIRNPASTQGLTEAGLDDRKLSTGGLVSDMGRRVDRILDMLEGQDDTLPQLWIDRLEKIELDYATWAVEAQHALLRDQLAATSKKEAEPQRIAQSLPYTAQQHVRAIPQADVSTAERQPDPVPSPQATEPQARRKPSLKLDLNQSKGHKREPSKVSVAESMYSTFSDISNAEIVDAKSTVVLPSPKVSVVDNPFRASKDELTWFGSSPAAQEQLASKPPMLQRASTTSIEMFSKEKLKEVVMKRSASWDMLAEADSSPSGTPSKALRQLNGIDSPTAKGIETVPNVTASPSKLWSSATHIQTTPQSQPHLPRRSSKRNTLTGLSPITPTTSVGLENEVPSTSDGKQTQSGHKKSESLDDKIQDILTTLPTKIRLAKKTDSPHSSTSTTRGSTPPPGLTLSPAKPDPSSRKSSIGDQDIRLYHLTRNGQGREAPPIKLFVRTVGDGDRVMVRVGGGWADLGEYLREYSLHHGSRVDERLEVTSFPGTGQATPVNGSSSFHVRRKSKSPTIAQTTFDSSDHSKARADSPRSGTPDRTNSKTIATLPPVPPIPSSYNMKSNDTTPVGRKPVAAATTTTQTTSRPSEASTPTRYSIVHGPGITTTTVVTPPVVSTSYTPLGGAGPKMNPRRVATMGAQPTQNEAWVQGMVGKARAVSGNGPTVVQSNGVSTTVTTTTTVTSTPPSKARRASSYFGLTPNNSHSSPWTIGTSPSAVSDASDSRLDRRASDASSRKSSRLSLSDIGGIRRVFLRKKSDGVAK